MKEKHKIHCGRTGLDEVLLLFVMPGVILAALMAGFLHLRKLQAEVPGMLRLATLSEQAGSSIEKIQQHRPKRDPLRGLEELLPVAEHVEADNDDDNGSEPGDSSSSKPVVNVFAGAKLTVSAIIVNEDRRVAVINDEVYEVGEQVAPGITLTSMAAGRVVLAGPDGTRKEIEVLTDAKFDRK